MFPDSMDWIHCSTGCEQHHPLFAWLTVILCTTVVIQYGIITYRWSKFDNGNIARSLQIIFVTCAICGYATLILSACPVLVNFAYSSRLLGLVLLNIANIIFIWLVKDKHFKAVADTEYLNEVIAEHAEATALPKSMIVQQLLMSVESIEKLVAAPTIARDKPLILIIDDDDEAFVTLITEHLGDNYETVREKNPYDGMKTATALSPDVIVCDWHLPGVEGRQLIDRLEVDFDTIAVTGTSSQALQPEDRQQNITSKDDLISIAKQAKSIATRNWMLRSSRSQPSTPPKSSS